MNRAEIPIRRDVKEINMNAVAATRKIEDRVELKELGELNNTAIDNAVKRGVIDAVVKMEKVEMNLVNGIIGVDPGVRVGAGRALSRVA